MMRYVPALLLLFVSPVMAHDHSRPELHDWYLSLTVPNDHSGFAQGESCCHETDCKPRPVRLVGGIYEAQGDAGNWLPIPALSVITDKGNPYLQAVICIRFGRINCAVMGKAGG